MIGETPAGPQEECPRAVSLLLLFAALALALLSARSYAGSWNDGSRLATVESLVDLHTLAIDRSIFVQVPPPGEASPYRPLKSGLAPSGTFDKVFIDGHYYSDKPPVPALWLAGLYQTLQWSTGLVARERPDRFCYWMTVGSAGLAFVVAVWCLYRLAQALQLPLSLGLLLTGSFGLSTMALPYARNVNAHILLLAVATALVLSLVRLAGQISWPRILGLGTLAGIGYTIDLGVGPVFLLCTLILVIYRTRSVKLAVVFLLAALPWVGLHHAVNYAIGGTIRPAGMVPQYFQWPGSPFKKVFTGVYNHPTIGHLLTYAAGLLVGPRGFFNHNLPVWLAVPASVALLRARGKYFPEVLYAAGTSIGAWAVYAVGSTNYSGEAVSIRWFVPLLAPGFFILCLFLRERPQYRADLVVLSVWGAVLGWFMWRTGPWTNRPVPFLWPLQAAALLTWGYVAWSRWTATR